MTIKIIRRGKAQKGEAEEVVSGVRHVKVLKKRPLTLREESVVAQVGKGMKNKGEILLNAGYAKSVAKNPKKVFDKVPVQEAIDPIIQKMKDERDAVIAQMKKTRHKAGYAVLSMSLGQLNRDIELLSGKPTSREEYTLPEEEQAKLRKLLKLNQ